MSTPSIQTLITQAQQVLNLKSSNEIRATLAAVLANANVGTPLNPNLTTQQLWDEFYEIVRQPSDDIMSIITDQMMRMVFSPPAPGGAGADKQVIFNDGGVLAGDTKFLWDKTANKLDVDGPVVITGVSTFAAGTALLPALTTTGDTNTGIYYPAADTFAVSTGGVERYRVDSAGQLGIGVTPSAWGGGLKALQVNGGASIAGDSANSYLNANTYYNGTNWIYSTTNGASRMVLSTSGVQWHTAPSGTAGNAITFTQDMTLDASGNLLVGVASANANGGVLQLKSGITFPATQVASSDANTLDDYEEGTFLPALATDTVNFTSVGYSIQAAKYTKVGNLVTFSGTIQTSSVVKGLASGAVVITGLPFAQPATDSRGDANCFAALAWAVDCPLSGEIITSAIYLLKRATSVSATATLTVADVSTGGSNNFVRFSGQYYV